MCSHMCACLCMHGRVHMHVHITGKVRLIVCTSRKVTFWSAVWKKGDPSPLATFVKELRIPVVMTMCDHLFATSSVILGESFWIPGPQFLGSRYCALFAQVKAWKSAFLILPLPDTIPGSGI